MFATTDDKVCGSAHGHFTFGVFLAQARGKMPMSQNDTTYLYVLDSATCNVGWCLAKHIRRPNPFEDG